MFSFFFFFFFFSPLFLDAGLQAAPSAAAHVTRRVVLGTCSPCRRWLQHQSAACVQLSPGVGTAGSSGSSGSSGGAYEGGGAIGGLRPDVVGPAIDKFWEDFLEQCGMVRRRHLAFCCLTWQRSERGGAKMGLLSTCDCGAVRFDGYVFHGY